MREDRGLPWGGTALGVARVLSTRSLVAMSRLVALAEYASARAATAAFSSLPAGAAERLGEALGRQAHRAGVRRRVVEEQIATAFPGRPPEWVRRTGRACYEHFGREMAALAGVARRGGGELRTRTAGAEEALGTYARASAEGRGAVIVTGHLGNWELAAAFLAASGIPLRAVVKRQRNRRFDRRLSALREAVGVEPVYMEEAARRAGQILGGGRPLAMVADQDARSRGVFVTFMGRPASTFRGPARLALEHGAPLLFGALLREEGGYRAVLERVETPPRGPGAVRALTAEWMQRLEAQVRLRPEQYFWFHRRWKTRPAAAVGGGGEA